MGEPAIETVDVVELRLAADSMDKGNTWFKDGSKVRQAAEEIVWLRRENDRHRAHNWIEFCEFLMTDPSEEEMTKWSDALERRVVEAERLVASGEFARLTATRSPDGIQTPPTSTQGPEGAHFHESHPAKGKP